MTYPGPHRTRVSTRQRSMFVFTVIASIAVAFTVIASIAVAAGPLDGADTLSGTGEPISLCLEDAELADLLRSFSKITDLNFAVVPEVNRYDLLHQSVSVTFESTPWDEVLDEILANAGLGWTHEGRVVWIHPLSGAPEGDRDFAGDEISLDLEGADLREVIQVFSAQTGQTFDLDPAVDAEVSVNLEDVPWDQALDLILRISGLAHSLDNGVVEIYPVTDARGMQLLPVRKRTAEGRLEYEHVYRYKKSGPVSEPRRISGPHPEYTEEARQAQTSGQVVVKVLIDSRGRVAYVEPLMELSHGLTEKAIEAVEQWIFEPAMLDGEPVPVEYILSVVFDLE
jgi:TonB family protein